MIDKVDIRTLLPTYDVVETLIKQYMDYMEYTPNDECLMALRRGVGVGAGYQTSMTVLWLIGLMRQPPYNTMTGEQVADILNNSLYEDMKQLNV